MVNSKNCFQLFTIRYLLLLSCHLFMAHEELIYRITRAVYGRLGAGTDERTVEQLVTDIYRAIEPVVEADGAGAAQGAESVPANTGEGEAGAAGSASRLVICG